MRLSTVQLKKGFTLIELIVVIAILGVLAAVLITTIDPLDKINSANDSGYVSSLAQLGRAEDTYAASHNNLYSPAANFAAAITALNTAGETKISAYTQPTGYTAPTFLTSPLGCDNLAVATNCIGYAFISGTLKSKKNTALPIYQITNGKGCYVAAAVTQGQLDTASGGGAQTGMCP